MQLLVPSMSQTTPTAGDVSIKTVTVTEEVVNQYASVTGDENPLHLDEEYAEETFFGEQIAHGMLAMGFVSAALAEYEGLIVYLSQDIQFEAPIPLGSDVIAECEIVEDLGESQYRVSTVVYDSTDDETKYIDGSAVIMIKDAPVEDEAEVEVTS